MSNKDNKRRIARIKKLLGKGCGQDDVTDLLADLRHFCDGNLVDFHASLDASYQHYLAEKAGS